MSGLNDFLAKLGFGTQQADKDAQKNLDAAKAAYGELQPPTLTPERPVYATASEQGPSAFNNIATNPAYREAQTDQIAALRNLAANGGRNAASDANLARIQQSENANARGQRDAILQNANARGVGGSGASLLAQLSSSQNQMNNQSLEDMNVRGQEQNTALNAGMGAANLGANLENQDYGQQANKAQAADAIARFNAGQKTDTNKFNASADNSSQQFNTGAQQTGYEDQYQKQSGISGSNMAGVNYNQNQANMGAQQAGNLLSGAVKLGTAASTKKTPGEWTGGKIPGVAPVPGDSSLNDIIPIKVSPEEVIVPKTLAKQGSSKEIVSFVKHPPNHNKEAMLSALKNIRSRSR